MEAPDAAPSDEAGPALVKVEDEMAWGFLEGSGVPRGRRGKQKPRDSGGMEKLLLILKEDNPMLDDEEMVVQALFDLANMTHETPENGWPNLGSDRPQRHRTASHRRRHQDDGDEDMDDEEADDGDVTAAQRGRRGLGRHAATAEDGDDDDEEYEEPAGRSRGRGARGSDAKRARVWHGQGHRGAHDRRTVGTKRHLQRSSSPEHDPDSDTGVPATRGPGPSAARNPQHAPRKRVEQSGPRTTAGWGGRPPPHPQHGPNAQHNSQRPPSRPSNPYPGPNAGYAPVPGMAGVAPHMLQMLQHMGKTLCMATLPNGMSIPVAVGPDGQMFPVNGWPGLPPFLAPGLAPMAHAMQQNLLAAQRPAVPSKAATARGSTTTPETAAEAPAAPSSSAVKAAQQLPAHGWAAGSSTGQLGGAGPSQGSKRKACLMHVEIAHWIHQRQKQQQQQQQQHVALEGAGEAEPPGVRGQGGADKQRLLQSSSGQGQGAQPGLKPDTDAGAAMHRRHSDGNQSTSAVHDTSQAQPQNQGESKPEVKEEAGQEHADRGRPEASKPDIKEELLGGQEQQPDAGVESQAAPAQGLEPQGRVLQEALQSAGLPPAVSMQLMERVQSAAGSGIPIVQLRPPGSGGGVPEAPVQGLPFGIPPSPSVLALIMQQQQNVAAMASGRAGGIPLLAGSAGMAAVRDAPHGMSVLPPGLIRGVQGPVQGPLHGLPAGPLPAHLAMLAGGASALSFLPGLQIPGLPLHALHGGGGGPGPPPGLGYVLAMPPGVKAGPGLGIGMGLPSASSPRGPGGGARDNGARSAGPL